MRKPAETGYPVHDLIRERWSPLAFSDQEIPSEAVGSLLEAARWAPSCYNEQPWRFIIASRNDTEVFDRLADCLVPGNRPWAENAPMLILSVARETYARNDKPNAWARHDVGLATAQLILQAEALGLSAHAMAGFDPHRARETFAIPEDHTPVAMIAVGAAGDPDRLPEDTRRREAAPRARKPLGEIAFGGTWGESTSLIGPE